ncbi:MAG: chitobiase/beta-hexosaminidase C-terminal domain-containing protein, partial [Planctomycetota bacterium]
WYNQAYLEGVPGIFALFEARDRLPPGQELPWVKEVKDDADWCQEIREHMAARVGYQLRLRSPQGSWPIGVRGYDTRAGYVGDFVLAPEAFADPENRRIQSAVEAASWPANVRSIRADPGLRPTYHSEWFPYGGYNLVREGWEHDSGYGAMFCSPQPGAYGGRRSRSNNNFFGLAAFGQDLVVEDKFDRYGLMGCPLEVDGLPQDFHAGLARVPMIAGHKQIPVAAWTEPANWRWHASDRFNLMEGIYDGPYAKADAVTLAAPEVPVTMQRGSVPLDQTLRGMRHQRWVHFVRDARLWIVTDRLRGEGEHAFAQHWYLPLEPGVAVAFAEDEIAVDPKARVVRTKSDRTLTLAGQETRKANVSLANFSKSDLGYATKIQRQQNSRMPHGQYRVTLSWRAAGESTVVTLIQPRRPGAAADEEIAATPLTGSGGATGFEAALADGARLRYLAAPGDAPIALTSGDVAIEGESLLTVEDRTHVRGVAMGCRRIERGGREVAVGQPDFEFSLATASPASPDVIPIRRPISPVAIGPERNVFTDEIAVTMTSKTPGVEIRYTLDGGEPTPQSALFTGPVTIRASAIVKARAYRPGVAANPPQNSGTHATATSRAVFDKRLPVKPVPAATVRKPQPGLVARYFEDDWRRLWLRLDSLIPVAEKRGVAPFDLAVVPDTNPPLGQAAAPRQKYFAVEYTGFMNVPETGVYTLHAPRESVIPDTDPGYELRIFLGQYVEPYGNRTQAFGLEEWYPATRLHAQGTWSIALEKGLHPIRIVHLDYRTDAPARLNQPGLKDYVWSGATPDVRLSGPGLEPRPIPHDWLIHGE